MSARAILPSRRQQDTQEVAWIDGQGGGHEFTVSTGRDEAGAVKEFFISGGKAGSAMRATLEDAAVVCSLALQFGATSGDLAHSLGRESDGRPASPIGEMIAAACGASPKNGKPMS